MNDYMQGSFGGKHIFTHNILLFVLLWYHHMPVHHGLLCTSLLWHTWLQPFIFFYQSTEAMVHAAVICLLVCTFLSQTRETRHLVNYSRITISMGFDYLKCLTCFSPLDMSDVEGLSLPRKPFHLFFFYPEIMLWVDSPCIPEMYWKW